MAEFEHNKPTPQETPNPSTPETLLHDSGQEHQADLSDFEQLMQREAPQKKEFDLKIQQWGTPSAQNILLMRQAGLDAETNKKDPQQKQAMLAARFLNQEPSQNSLGTQTSAPKEKSYKISFDNETAENYLGLGHLLPSNVETVKVVDQNGWVISERAVRGINRTNRIGYYDEKTKAYVPVHSGYKVIVLQTRTAKKQPPDMVLARRDLMEEAVLFNPPQPASGTDTGSPSSPSSDKPSTQSDLSSYHEDSQQSLGAAQPTGTPDMQNGHYDRGQLRQMGFGPPKRLPPEMVQKAHEILGQRQAIGTTTFITYSGKTYAFRDEVHQHRQDENVSDALKKPHHGISVFEKHT